MDMNKVKDYPLLQAVKNPADLSIQIRRDLNTRYITIENSSLRNTVGVYLSVTDVMEERPEAMFWLAPGEIRHLGVNPMNTVDQFIHLINPETGRECGQPMVLRHNANQFVLRDALNSWYVAPFKRIDYRAAK